MFNFNALLNRLKYIPRWSLMRQTNGEDVAQHTTQVMLIAHTLCMISTGRFGREADSEKVVLCRLYHDAPEILTGDMPTPVKYHSRAMQTAYRDVEAIATGKLVETAAPFMKDDLTHYMTGDILTDHEKKLLKAADRLSALIKCMEELGSGNTEFKAAFNSTKKLLDDMDMDEVRYFTDNMLPGYSLCLDDLAKI
ncbi:MAG: 5'-deoxynucleotidase [Oscillospiraceae bacterium]|nr:5'-deoxynucleotidase [Oscillospiraceae bacterium]